LINQALLLLKYFVIGTKGDIWRENNNFVSIKTSLVLAFIAFLCYNNLIIYGADFIFSFYF